jgi:hypothetical protein
MAVTYQYVDPQFKIVSAMLDFVPVTGSHSGRNLAEKLIEVFDDYCIQSSQVFTITVDNATSNDMMIDHLIQNEFVIGPEHHIRCFAHILNPRDLLEFILPLVKQTRVNCKYKRSSPQRLQQFKMHCTINSEKFNKHQLDAKTRWNSTHNMLKVALKMKKSMNDFIAKQGLNTTFEQEIGDEIEESSCLSNC